MAVATIQITQGAIVGGSGESVIGFDATTLITLTDDGGAGATSYLWEVISWPGPDASAPTIGSSTLQVATITPPGGGLTDGVYVVRLTREDGVDGITTDVKFFAVEDGDGLSLPVAGMNRNMSNVGGSAAAQDAGWFGSTAGGTNVFLDAFLRLRRLREGRYLGLVGQVNHVAGTPATGTFTWGVDDPIQELTINGTGTYTADLAAAGAQEGATFRFLISYYAAAGNFAITDDGGPSILTLTAPPASFLVYEAHVYFDGTNWKLRGVQILNNLLLSNVLNQTEIMAVAGVQSTSEGTFQRAGTFQLDPSIYPASQQFTFVASFDTTNAGNAAYVQLYNVTDTAVVGSAFTTTSTVNQTQSAVVTLPASLKDYEIQIRLNSADPAERATVTRASIIAKWG